MNLKNKVIDVEISEEISGNLRYHTDDLINTRTVYLVLGVQAGAINRQACKRERRLFLQL